jgi:DNA processing protein
MNPALTDQLRLARTERIGPVSWRRLVAEYGDAATALSALPEKARRAGSKQTLEIPTQAAIEDEIASVRAHGGRLITLTDAAYPALLAELPDSPPVLTVLGDSNLLISNNVAIVGARNASAAGMRMAESLATELANAGYTVTSGLARGVDGAAHRGAMFNGRTIAAIAGGIDVIYPPEHAGLQEEIARLGVIVTEAPFGTRPQARHFPRRNRLIAGLSLGCVVIEAAAHSGSLITAELADRYSRTVLAVPGSPLDPRNTGSNGLLKNGAVLVENATDVIQGLSRKTITNGFSEPAATWGENGQSDTVSANVARETLISLLSFTPTSVDDLTRRCHFSTQVVLTALTELELAGLAEILPGGGAVLLP